MLAGKNSSAKLMIPAGVFFNSQRKGSLIATAINAFEHGDF